MKNINFLVKVVNKRQLISMVILTILISVMNSVEPVIIKDTITGSNVAIGTSLLLGTTIFSRALSVVRAKLSNKLANKTMVDLQEMLFEHFLHKDLSKIEAGSTGYMENLEESTSQTVGMLVKRAPEMIAEMISGIVCSVVILRKLSPSLLISTLPFLVLMVAFELTAPKILFEKNYVAVREVIQKLVQFRTDKFAGIKDIISFNMQDKELNELRKMNREYLDKNIKKSDSQILYANTMYLLRQLADVIVIIVGCISISNNNLTVTDVLLFFTYSYILYNPIMSIADFIDILTDGIVAVDKISKELEIAPVVTSDSTSCEPEIKGRIVLNNVDFSYDEQNVLEDVNIEINPGEFVALVGPSGAGKSTIAKLISRMYDVSDGSVSIDGVDIRDIDLGYLRSSIGTVNQDARLFNGTVMDNILYAAPEGATEEDAINAAKAANADEFIRNLPQGYDTNIGENGVKLSGGQKQRIAIARLFLNNPSICIFDEATSALDNKSEKLVKESMDNLSKNRTSIVIAHRLDTIRNADKIIYIDHGVKEQGTHEELVALKGAYYELYQRAE